MRIRGRGPSNAETIDVAFNGERIGAITTEPLPDYEKSRKDLLVAAGFIDLQLNGYGGIDFNDIATTTEQIAELTQRLWQTGVTSFCPTIVTESAGHISTCLTNIVRAAEKSSEFARAFIGIHLEGPFISPEDGPRGAHPRQHVCPPDWNQFQRWQEAADGQIRLLTLSPEWPESLDFIERAAASGAVVAIGHTAATPQQIADAVKAGAKMSTHLGNGSHAKIDRHPNYIWEQLANDALWASFIVDGHHLPPSVVKCFLRSKGIARSILVTDAIAAAGCPPGKYKLGNIDAEVLETGRVCLPGTPYLAGSALNMHDAIANTVKFSDATIAEALQMASANPAELLRLKDRGKLETGRRADLVLFDWQEASNKIQIVGTVVGGEVVYSELL